MAHKGEKSNGSHYDSSGATKNVYSKKKRTSFVNENDWWSKLAQGFEYLKRGGSYEPQKIIRSMEKREGLSKQKTDTKGIKPSMGYRGKNAVSMKIEERDRTGEAGWRRHIKKWDRDADKKLINTVIGGGGKKGPNWKNYNGSN